MALTLKTLLQIDPLVVVGVRTCLAVARDNPSWALWPSRLASSWPTACAALPNNRWITARWGQVAFNSLMTDTQHFEHFFLNHQNIDLLILARENACVLICYYTLLARVCDSICSFTYIVFCMCMCCHTRLPPCDLMVGEGGVGGGWTLDTAMSVPPWWELSAVTGSLLLSVE